MTALLAAVQAMRAPYFDYHALAPEMILTAVIVVAIMVDSFVDETRKGLVTQLCGVGCIVALVPVVTLAISGSDRQMFDGAYVVDNMALAFKVLFIVAAYVVLLMSSREIAEGDYDEGEFGALLVSAVLGMTVMASARDLLSIFVALELLSLPGYMLAGWRKRDLRSNEAALKYYLLGVLSSGVMLYGMSLIFGITGQTNLYRISDALAQPGNDHALVAIGIFFIVVGFAFKVSAVPFHFWAPDTYEGAPLPVTAFLSVASKAAGFVALIQLIFIGFFGQREIWEPLFFGLAAATMIVGNVIAIRQTNAVRMLAYSSIAQAGYILVPFAIAAEGKAASSSLSAIVAYLLIYTAMNLGAFATVMAVARRTNSAEISSFAGLFSYAPGLTVLMTVFLFSLAGIPPFGGWFAKFYIFRAVIDAHTPAAIVLGVIVAVNSVIALYYYSGIARQMWMTQATEGADRSPIAIPAPLSVALGLTVVITVATGIYPQVFAHLSDFPSF